MCTAAQTPSKVELESSVDDSPFQDSENLEQPNISRKAESSLEHTLIEEHTISPMELEVSLEDPPLQSEVQATTPVSVSFQLVAEGTKRGHNKLIDSLGYT